MAVWYTKGTLVLGFKVKCLKPNYKIQKPISIMYKSAHTFLVGQNYFN